MKPTPILVLFAVVSTLVMLKQRGEITRLTAARIRQENDAAQTTIKLSRENFILGLKSGYILRAKNGTKEDIEQAIASWPSSDFIVNFSAK